MIDLATILKRAEGASVMSDAEEVVQRARDAAHAREQCLDHAQPAITARARAAVIHDCLESTQALQVAQRWLTGSFPSILALVGDVGTGKTVAASWALARMLGRYVTAEEWTRRYASHHWRDADWCEAQRRTGLLVLDDLGTESQAPPAKAAIFDLINRRMTGAYKTIITGNLSRADLLSLYDARTVSRLHESCVIVDIRGDDMRKRAAK